MEDIISIAAVISGIILSVVNVAVQTAKRTVNKWACEILEIGKINSIAASEIGTVYSNPITNWCLEVDSDNRFKILRNQKIREKIREYKQLKKTRNILMLVFFVLGGLSLYLFMGL